MSPIELNFKGAEMRKLNILMDRTQRADEKNEIICLVIMFTHGVMVIKIVELGQFLYFLLMAAKKKSHGLGKKYLSAPARFSLALL